MSQYVDFDVMKYGDGTRLAAGLVCMPLNEAGKYLNGVHPAYKWPAGVARAGDVLTVEQLEKISLSAETVVYLE